MAFTAQDYLDAATERLGQAVELYERSDHALSIFTAGLAVECLLRAYRLRHDPEFESRHRLSALYRESRLAQNIAPGWTARIGGAIVYLDVAWSNDHRFRPEARLREFLKRRQLDRRIRGDMLKEVARRSVNAAHHVVSHGVTRWSPRPI